MKRILICASRMSHLINFHLPYIEYFKKHGYAVHIAAEGAVAHPLIDECYDMRFVKNPLSPANLRTVGRLKGLIRENGYTMVYSNSTLAGAALRLALKGVRKNRPYCVHISHGYMFDEGRSLRSLVYRSAERLTAGVTDALVVMNGEDLRLAEKYGLGKKIYFTNGMGLRRERFPEISPEERSSFRKEQGFDETNVIFLCVGEFSGRKNQTMLIEAFDRVQKDHPEAALIFAGEGGTMQECRELTERLELIHCVRFLGQVANVGLLYRSCDALVSGAKMEGLPFNVMEALHCSTPVIASEIKGHTDLITDGKNGLLFDLDAKDPVPELAKALSTYLDDTNTRSRLRANARLDDKYYIESVEPKLLSILDRDFDEAQIKTPEVSYL